LPPVQPRINVDAASVDSNAALPIVHLATDSLPEYRQPTLAEAARNNDFVTFDALYTATERSGLPVAAFAPLHELWSWSMSDPIGAFYGRDLHNRLARAYPGFAAYIAPYLIVDSNGNAFWPTSETRAFLLEQAMSGETRRIQIAEARPRAAIRTEPAARSSSRRSRTAIRKNGPAKRAAAKPAPVERTADVPSAKVAGETPAVQTNTATAIVTEPAPVVVAAPVPAPAPAPISSPQTATTAPAPAPAQKDAFPTGIVMLLLLALIGIGLFAMIMRTPKEERMPPIIEQKPPAPVEPLRRAAGQNEARGSGSLGSVEPPPHSPSSPDHSHHDGGVRGLRR
jgi:hypothetical protein